jgi:hypothetical protein
VKVVTIKLPEDLDHKVARAAARAGVSKSSVVRDALVAYLGESRAGGGGGPSVFDVVGHVIGAVVGPGLAATDPERMKGYGR